VTANVASEKRDGQIVYYNGMVPIFMHDEDDLASFKVITSPLYINGAAKQVEIVDAFAINPLAPKRRVKAYRAEGPAAFYARKPRGRKASKKAPTMAKATPLYACH
jgi:hypothetical protein